MAADPQLRDLKEEDLPVLFEHQSDPVARRMAAFVSKDSPDFTAFSERWQKILADETVVKKTVELNGRVVGMIASFERNSEREVTYWLGREYWNRNIATIALGRFMQMIETRPVYARAAKDNVASIRVLEKCGFAFVGEERFFANARDEEIGEVIYKLG